MRSVTYVFAVSLLAAMGQYSAATAQTPPAEPSRTNIPQRQPPQTAVPQAQSPDPDTPQPQPPAQTNTVATISDQKLDAAAAAIQRIGKLDRDYLQLFKDASPEDQPRIANEARYEVEKAITDQGLSIEEYASIVEIAQKDPQVRQKIVQRMQQSAR